MIFLSKSCPSYPKPVHCTENMILIFIKEKLCDKAFSALSLLQPISSAAGSLPSDPRHNHWDSGPP